MVHRLTNRKEKEDLMIAFKALDTNKDGKLSKEELKTAYSTTKESISLGDLEQLMSTLDTNGSGFVDYSGRI
jgi:Ca2+-binding EF-hand superfamily protein